VLRTLATNLSWQAPCWLVALSLSLFASEVCADEQAVNATTRSATGADVRSPAEQAQASTHVPDRTGTSGLALGAGLGSDNVWLGGHVLYYAQLPNPKLRVAFHVGAGVYPWPNVGVSWGVRGGSFVSYGKRHRLVFGVMGGTIDWQAFGLHSRTLETRQVFGVGVGLGYEFMTESGFYLRATVGPALEVYRKVPFFDREVALVWRGNLLSMGYKLW
jgi:hypothetical protein